MSIDPKMKRLIRSYGVEGYGVYNYILELIVRRLETESPMPDLEESSEDIASDFSMDTLQVERIIKDCLDYGLFEYDEISGRIVAHKIYAFLDKATTRSFEIKSMIEAYNGLSAGVPDSPGLSVPEQNRTEHIRLEESHDTGFEDVKLTAVEYDKLVEKYPKDFVEQKILHLAAWQSEKETVKKSAYRTLLNWLKDDYDKWRRENPQPALLKTCGKCGADIVPGLSYCRECGENI